MPTIVLSTSLQDIFNLDTTVRDLANEMRKSNTRC